MSHDFWQAALLLFKSPAVKMERKQVYVYCVVTVVLVGGIGSVIENNRG